MKNLKKYISLSIIIAVSGCSDDEESTTIQTSSDNASSNAETINVYSVDFKGLKLGMTEAEASAQLDKICQKDGKPSWKKEENDKLDGLFYGAELTCTGDGPDFLWGGGK